MTLEIVIEIYLCVQFLHDYIILLKIDLNQCATHLKHTKTDRISIREKKTFYRIFPSSPLALSNFMIISANIFSIATVQFGLTIEYMRKSNISSLKTGLGNTVMWVAESTMSNFRVVIQQGRKHDSEDSVAVRDYSYFVIHRPVGCVAKNRISATMAVVRGDF